jgi:hypothetical protein
MSKMEGGGVSQVSELRREIASRVFKLYAILIYSDADASLLCSPIGRDTPEFVVSSF